MGRVIAIVVGCVAVLIVLAGLFVFTHGSNELSRRSDSAGLNGGFEDTDSGYPTNWAFFPDPETDDLLEVSVDTTRAQEGEKCVKLVVAEGGRAAGFRSRRAPLTAGKTYRIGMSVRNRGCTLTVRCDVMDASGMTNMRSDTIVKTSTDSDDWRRFEETLSAAEGEAKVSLVFLVEGPGTLWCDDVRIEEIAD